MLFRRTNDAINIVTRDAVIKGNLNLKNSVEIFGQVLNETPGNSEPAITTEGHAVINKDAVVNGSIKAEFAYIEGEVNGDVCVNGKLYLAKSSYVKGNLEAEALVMEEGVFFEGVVKNRPHPHEDTQNSKMTVLQSVMNLGKKLWSKYMPRGVA